MNEPEVLEAQANERVAQSVLSTTEGSRYPVIQGTITQSAVQTNGDRSNLMPGLRANWTVYDFGKRQAEIRRDEFAVRYYNFKTDEAVEELAYELATIYLEALSAKMSLNVANENLARHKEIVNKLRIILEYDPGRRSEYTQAKAREIQVRESIINYQRALSLVLQRLNRYVTPPVSEAELSDPFTQDSVESLLARYYVSEEMAKTHPSYLAQQEEVSRLQAVIEVLEKGRYPSLDLQAEANKDDAALYVVFGGDIFNATTQPSIDEQKYKMDAALARLQQVYDSLKERADVAVIQMQEDQARIDIANNQIRALEQVVLDYEDQFIIAARSLLDVVNAYSELASAKTMQVNAKYDLMLGKLDYLASLGVVGDWADISPLSASTTELSSSDQAFVDDSQTQGLRSIKSSSEQFVYVNRNGNLTRESLSDNAITAAEVDLSSSNSQPDIALSNSQELDEPVTSELLVVETVDDEIPIPKTTNASRQLTLESINANDDLDEIQDSSHTATTGLFIHYDLP